MNLITKLTCWVFSKFGPEERAEGRDRQVFIFKNKVIKVPQMTDWFSFIRGYYSNLKELDSIQDYTGNFKEHLPVILGSYCFGLIVVYVRYKEVGLVNSEDETARYKERLVRIRHEEKPSETYIWFNDPKIFNYGWDKFGRLIVIDIGTSY